MQRRSFIEMFLAGTASAVGLPQIALMDDQGVNWNRVKKQFPDESSSVLNFNNGSAGMIPRVVEKNFIDLLKEMNRLAPYQALEAWGSINQKAKSLLAQLIGAQKEEVAIVRNTTEALNYVFSGIEIPKNSTVVCCKYDYGSAINVLERLAEEKKFNIKYVDIVLPASEEEIVNAYEREIDDECSMVLLTAMTYREGQILPIKQLTKIAKRKGALVVVDAAHAIGHYDHSVSDWDCDYYCTSLHKWLSCPIGSGLLYMKKELISETKGSYNAERALDSQMKKFEVVGTKPFAVEASILSALYFQNSIGLKAKNDRLKGLTDYWVKGMEEIPNVTTFKPEEYGAICTFHYPGRSTKIIDHLKAHKIHIKKVYIKNYPKESRTRYRVSPNIYHDFKDLDRLIEAMKIFEVSK